MATNPYNAFGQILASGGERSVAMLIADGADNDRIIQFFARNYPQAGPQDRDDTVAIANAGLGAASSINATPLMDRLPLGQIPVNGAIFGDDPQGARLRLAVSILDQSGKPSFTAYLDGDGTETLEEFINAAVDQFQRACDSDPTACDRLADLLDATITAVVIFADRRF
jgi:hypothetical protein